MTFISQHKGAVLWSLVLHIAVIGVLLTGIALPERPRAPAAAPLIEGTLVDTATLQRQQQARETAARQERQRQQRVERERQQAAEQQRLERQREEQRVAAEKAETARKPASSASVRRRRRRRQRPRSSVSVPPQLPLRSDATTS
jgi:colicin import membrane protein